MLNSEQIQELFNVCDTRYKKIDDCNETVAEVNGKLSNDNTRFAVLELQQKINNWLTAAIASGIVAIVIKIFFGG